MKKWLAYSFVFLGGFITVLGVVFIFMYVWDAIISRLGEPDQSLIFWELPILFLGLISSVGGLKLFLRGIDRIRNMRNDYP